MNINSTCTKAILLIICFGVNCGVIAQGNLRYVSGNVRDGSNYEPISYAFVRNSMSNVSIIADEQGKFTIPIHQGDLLKITAIGFEDGFYIISDTTSIINDFPIQLKPKIYELKEVTLTPYKTILQFKHAFTQLQLPKTNLDTELHLPGIKHHLPDENTQEMGGISFMSPISALYNTFSHKGKMDKKYRGLLANDDKDKIVRKRFTPYFVSSIINFETEEELDAFIKFCQFDFSFLLNASEYELIAEIQKKHVEYLRSKLP